jgi:hypothetical protein
MAPKRSVEVQNKQAARLREWRGKTRRNTLLASASSIFLILITVSFGKILVG